MMSMLFLIASYKTLGSGCDLDMKVESPSGDRDPHVPGGRRNIWQ